MQNCAKCHSQSPDTTHICHECGADLREHSTTATALREMLNNPRVRAIRLSVPEDACPACRALQGIYAITNVPSLPVAGCSEPNGCTGFYEPILNEVFP